MRRPNAQPTKEERVTAVSISFESPDAVSATARWSCSRAAHSLSSLRLLLVAQFDGGLDEFGLTLDARAEDLSVDIPIRVDALAPSAQPERRL